MHSLDQCIFSSSTQRSRKEVNQLLYEREGGKEKGRVPFCNSYIFRGIRESGMHDDKSSCGADMPCRELTMKIQVRAIVEALVVSNFRKPV